MTGAPDALATWLGVVREQGGYVAETRTVGADGYALVLAPAPLELDATLSGVTFEELRAGARSGMLGWLWDRLDQHRY